MAKDPQQIMNKLRILHKLTPAMVHVLSEMYFNKKTLWFSEGRDRKRILLGGNRDTLDTVENVYWMTIEGLNRRGFLDREEDGRSFELSKEGRAKFKAVGA